MYQLKNGILHRANRKIFALGQSYYPSFHPQKHPVPPDQDRVGEMKKDFADMAAAGFELVRLAAVGRVRRDNGKIVVDFPLPDQLCSEAEKAGLTTCRTPGRSSCGTNTTKRCRSSGGGSSATA